MTIAAFDVRLEPFETVTHTDLNGLFDTFYNYANGLASVHVDASNAYTAIPSIGAEPTGSTQMTRYSYSKQHPMFVTKQDLNNGGLEAVHPATAGLDSPWKSFNTSSENSLKVACQAGAQNVSYTAGVGTLTWPTAWTTGVLAVMLTNGDSDVPGTNYHLRFTACSLTTLTLLFGNFTGSHITNYLAFGW